jgi:hypothetical protein
MQSTEAPKVDVFDYERLIVGKHQQTARKVGGNQLVE